ncbi:transcriptional regulator, LysR family [gamma proteobacterium HTCC5015]|nr:transcriptional regulator, LysR family [gamma proteobacterium HTCC5015]
MDIKTTHPRITLEQWRCFVAVIDCGGFAQAAEALNKSQSTVSYAVNKLKSVLGLEVLTMSGRRAVLTEAGQVMYRGARQLLEESVALEGLVKPLQSEWETSLTLVIDEAFPLDVVLSALKAFEPQSRGTRVHYHEAILSGSEEALDAGTADLVVAYRVPPGYSGDQIYSAEFVAVTGASHPLAGSEKPLQSRALQKHTHIVIRDSGRYKQTDTGWLRSQQRWTVSSIQTAVKTVLSGVGFAWLPLHAVSEYLNKGELVRLNLEQGATRRGDLYLVYGHSDYVGPATKTLAQSLIQASEAYSV